MTSTLYLLNNVDLDPNYNYTIDFNTLAEQDKYFDDKVVNVLEQNTGYSYLRVNKVIKVQVNIDDLEGINYLYYINKNKRYYAFITSKEYVSQTCTAIQFKIDVMQTFMFDYEIQNTYIEREHQDRFKLYPDSDKPNELCPIWNSEYENIDTGNEFIKGFNKQIVKDNENAPDNLVWLEIVATQPISTGSYSSEDPSTEKNFSSKLSHYGISSGLYSYILPHIIGETTKFFATDATGTILQINNAHIEDYIGESEALLAIRVLPYAPVEYTIVEYNGGYKIDFTGGLSSVRVVTANNSNFGGVNLQGFGGYYFNLRQVTKNNHNYYMATRLNDFTYGDITMAKIYFDINTKRSAGYGYFEPKLKTSQFYYKQLCDYQSEPLKIKNELIDQPSSPFICIVQNFGVLSKMKYFVKNYKGDANGKFSNVINSTISELPLKSSAYISYMAQNKASATTGMAINIGASVAQLGLGALTGGLGLAVAGSQAINIGSQIANNIVKLQDLKDTPDSIRQAGNNAEFDIMDGNFKIEITEYSISREYIPKVEEYFFHYGYACKQFKIPNLRSRYYFNYIKTIGANIKTNIDADYKQELVNIFDNGITIWHYRDSATFKGVNNYDYNNTEMNLKHIWEETTNNE